MNELNDELKYEMKSTLVSLHYEEVEKEFMEEVKNQITSEDIIKLLIAKIYDIPELKKEVAKRIKTIIIPLPTVKNVLLFIKILCLIF